MKKYFYSKVVNNKKVEHEALWNNYEDASDELKIISKYQYSDGGSIWSDKTKFSIEICSPRKLKILKNRGVKIY
jgi:hypothetical protein